MMGVVSEAATAVVQKSIKLRLKILSKKPTTGVCQGSEQVTGVSCLEKSSGISVSGDRGVNRKLGSDTGNKYANGVPQVSKANCFKILLSSGDQVTNAAGSEKFNSFLGHKRRSEGELEGKSRKRLKMDRLATSDCRNLLHKLMKHPLAAGFLQPVDPVLYGIHDYFDIVKHPMDLGTIKRKLFQNKYAGAEEFEADVRLTFSNAMLYNPPHVWAHKHAKQLNQVFEALLKAKLGKVRQCGKQKSTLDIFNKNVNDTKGNFLENASSVVCAFPKKSTLRQENGAKDLEKLSVEMGHCDSISVNGRIAGGSKPSRPAPGSVDCLAKEEVGSVSARVECKNAPVSASVECNNVPADKILHSELIDVEVKNVSKTQISKPDQDSRGAVSCVDEEHIGLSNPTTAGPLDATNKDLETILECELSPRALRALNLKRRFADTIFKAQTKTLLEQGSQTDAMVLQQEKEKLERKHLEDKAKIEAQVKAVKLASRLKAEDELKRQRQQAREAARAALEKMERSIDLDDNFHTSKDLESLVGRSMLALWNGSRPHCTVNQFENRKLGSPLERLGLYIKSEFSIGYDDDEVFLEEKDLEEGEVVL